MNIIEELLEWKSSVSRSRKLRLTAVGIRCADHATLSIRKVGTNFADLRRSLGRYNSLADWSRGVQFSLLREPLSNIQVQNNAKKPCSIRSVMLLFDMNVPTITVLDAVLSIPSTVTGNGPVNVLFEEHMEWNNRDAQLQFVLGTCAACRLWKMNEWAKDAWRDLSDQTTTCHVITTRRSFTSWTSKSCNPFPVPTQFSN
jgi:hypothetical protein